MHLWMVFNVIQKQYFYVEQFSKIDKFTILIIIFEITIPLRHVFVLEFSCEIDLQLYKSRRYAKRLIKQLWSIVSRMTENVLQKDKCKIKRNTLYYRNKFMSLFCVVSVFSFLLFSLLMFLEGEVFFSI